jgi:DNA-3-methyladenine glycosylase
MASSDGLRRKMKKEIIIPSNFYTEADVVKIARHLIGKFLVLKTQIGKLTGCIVETEAYAGTTDKASHAYNGRFTKRTEVLYRKGGIAYTYRCYGMYTLLNIVTGMEGIPHAVLIRGIIPVEGLDIMKSRANHKINLLKDGIGPGRLTRLMGISMDLNGTLLDGSNTLHFEEKHLKIDLKAILKGPRIGVDYADEHALLPYRFRIEAEYALETIKKAGLIESRLV